MTVLVWAPDEPLRTVLPRRLQDLGHAVRVLDGEAELAVAHTTGSLLVAVHGAGLQDQHELVRGPLVVVDPAAAAPVALTRRAYAVVDTPEEAALLVDRFFEHQRLARRAAGRRGSPARCSRCGRGFDARKVRDGTIAQRFVRFGSVALCGGCVEDLRHRLRDTDTAVVEADVSRR